MGVYFIPADAGVTIDLTDHVIYEDTNPTVRLGAGPRPLTVVNIPGSRQ
jgi:hypothetical protein